MIAMRAGLVGLLLATGAGGGFAGAQTPTTKPSSLTPVGATTAAASSAADILAKAMTAGGPPAMGLVVIRDGRVTDQAVRGVRRTGSADPVRADDLWQIGSNGKAVTAALIARLVDQGRLSWTKPLDQMLPKLAAEMRPEYRDVTLIDLLSHRAGLREPGGGKAEDAYFQSFYTDRRPLPQQRLDWARAALSLEPVGPKRAAAAYSNTGYVLAGVIAEEATGQPFEALVARHVLRPLGMRSATYAPGKTPSQLVGHFEGRPATEHDANPLMWAPAGALRLSLRDWTLFCLDQLEGAQGRGKLLRPASYRILQTAQSKDEGLGWSVMSDFAGREGPILTHTGSDGNWYAAVALFPQTRDGMLVVANAGRSMGGDKAVMKTSLALLPSMSRPLSAVQPPAAKPTEAP